MYNIGLSGIVTMNPPLYNEHILIERNFGSIYYSAEHSPLDFVFDGYSLIVV
jgi:hypothetical protein